MSKMDALRAMREARYAEAADRAKRSAPAKRPAAPVAPAETPRSKVDAVAPLTDAGPAEPDTAEDLCGHRNMGGRTCTREAGHAAKSHRYS